MANVFEPDGPAARGGRRVTRVAAAAGAQRLGASVVELAPGAVSSPYHLHHGNEELLIVLAGAPELRTPAGTRALARGDVVSFPRGPDGAHQLSNASGEPCLLLFVSEMHFPDVVEYPDTGATLALTGPRAGHAFPGGGERPLAEVVAAAMDAGPRSAL
jgi:uncharacterized cupin superfamily protein